MEELASLVPEMKKMIIALKEYESTARISSKNFSNLNLNIKNKYLKGEKLI